MVRHRHRRKKDAESEAVVQQPTPPTQDGLENGTTEADPMEKDTAELELEKLVFGDSEGFREGLKNLQSADESLDEQRSGLDDQDQDQEDERDLGTVDDSDLFFLDSGPAASDGQALAAYSRSSEESDQEEGIGAAWEDSEDERMQVSLASNPRLKKLRNSEKEDVIGGKEYIKRLRRQFERLHPSPDWVAEARESDIQSRKRRRKSDVNGSAHADEEGADEDDAELAAQPLAKFLQNPTALTSSSSDRSRGLKLRPEVINIQRCPDIQDTQPSAITNLEFHPQLPSVLLTSGPSSLMSLYQTATTPAPTLLSTLQLRTSSPLSISSFLPPQGLSLYFSTLSRRNFHIWDLPSGVAKKVNRVYGHGSEQRNMSRFKLSPCGRYMALLSSTKRGGASSEGSINIIDAATTQWVTAAQLESPSSTSNPIGISDFLWWQDGEGLTLTLKSGEVGEFSLSQRRFVARWVGEGVTNVTTAIMGARGGPKMLGGDRYIVIGSTSGMVDVFDRRQIPQSVAISASQTQAAEQKSVLLTPLKTLSQLTTPISHIVLSPDGQVFSMSSRWKRDALRLVHLPSCTIYRNWPTDGTPLGRVTSVAWARVGDGRDGRGPQTQMLRLAVGNEAGKVRLWEVRP